MNRWLGLLTLVAILAACGGETDDPAGSKPTANPDEAVNAGKADALSNHWTTRQGELDGDGDVVDAWIDYPDWFHGYTVELTAGRTIDVHVTATQQGYVRMYGPSHRAVDGEPQFRNAVVRGVTGYDWETGLSRADFSFTAPEEGTYMVLYGPEYVWQAGYRLELECTNCQTERCASDADCADGFCGYDADRNRLCKPHALEGETCGGFVPAELFVACPPELSCVAPTFIADIPGSCGVAVTVEELRADPAAYDGRFVGVKGHVQTGYAACTRIGCPPEDPCCNQCSARQLLRADSSEDRGASGIALEEGGEFFGCSGNECTVDDNCTVEDGVFWIGGVFRAATTTSTQPTIEVSRRYRGF